MTNQFIFIHTGYPKCASSFLQKMIFSNPDYGFYSPWKPEDYVEELSIPSCHKFQPQKARAFFEVGIQSAGDNALIPVITHEGLCIDFNHAFDTSKVMADRLFNTFPEGKILIIIREQSDFILSLYQQYVRDYLSISIQKYLKTPPARSGFSPRLRLDYLEYDHIISYYFQKFGHQNVLVLPYEMLKNDKTQFIQRIAHFTDTEIPLNFSETTVNPSYSGLTLILKQWSNRFLSSGYATPNRSWLHNFNNRLFYKINQIIPPSLSKKFDRYLKQEIQTQINHYYQSSNTLTSQLIGIDLKKYGYQTLESEN